MKRRNLTLIAILVVVLALSACMIAAWSDKEDEDWIDKDEDNYWNIDRMYFGYYPLHYEISVDGKATQIVKNTRFEDILYPEHAKLAASYTGAIFGNNMGHYVSISKDQKIYFASGSFGAYEDDIGTPYELVGDEIVLKNGAKDSFIKKITLQKNNYRDARILIDFQDIIDSEGRALKIRIVMINYNTGATSGAISGYHPHIAPDPLNQSVEILPNIVMNYPVPDDVFAFEIEADLNGTLGTDYTMNMVDNTRTYSYDSRYLPDENGIYFKPENVSDGFGNSTYIQITSKSDKTLTGTLKIKEKLFAPGDSISFSISRYVNMKFKIDPSYDAVRVSAVANDLDATLSLAQYTKKDKPFVLSSNEGNRYRCVGDILSVFGNSFSISLSYPSYTDPTVCKTAITFSQAPSPITLDEDNSASIDFGKVSSHTLKLNLTADKTYRVIREEDSENVFTGVSILNSDHTLVPLSTLTEQDWPLKSFSQFVCGDDGVVILTLRGKGCPKITIAESDTPAGVWHVNGEPIKATDYSTLQYYYTMNSATLKDTLHIQYLIDGVPVTSSLTCYQNANFSADPGIITVDLALSDGTLTPSRRYYFEFRSGGALPRAYSSLELVVSLELPTIDFSYTYLDSDNTLLNGVKLNITNCPFKSRIVLDILGYKYDLYLGENGSVDISGMINSFATYYSAFYDTMTIKVTEVFVFDYSSNVTSFLNYESGPYNLPEVTLNLTNFVIKH